MSINFFEIIRIIGDVAVPAFFMLSSYLFFRNFTIDKYKEKLIKRIHSLVIPYFIWSIIFWSCYALITVIPIFSKLIVQNDFSFAIIDILKNIGLATYDPPIWFIRTLFQFVLITPIIYYTIKKWNKYSLVIPIVFIILNLIFKFSYAGITSLLFWLPLFYVGAYMAINKKELIEREILITKNRKTWIVLTAIIYICIVLINIFQDEKSVSYYLYRIISPIFVWILLDYIKVKNINIKPWMNDTFFIFCVHYPIITIIKRLLVKIIGTSKINIFCAYILSIIITIAIIFILAKIMKKYFSKLWSILNGRRV